MVAMDDSSNMEQFPKITETYSNPEHFAEGGVAVISRADDKTLERKVAVKSLKKTYFDRPDIVKSFIDEARLTAQLDHPAIVPVHSINSDDGEGVHFTMKLIDGVHFQQYIESQVTAFTCLGHSKADEKRALSARLEHFLKVCDATSYANSKHVVHRDLKPENIMIGNYNQVYLMDWGIATKLSCSKPEHDVLHAISGTPAYIAPELLDRKTAVNIKTDIYSLGVILFEVATLKEAFRSESIKEQFEKAIRGESEALTHRFPGIRIPRDLKAIIRKGMAVDPNERYDTVKELADDVRNYLINEEVSARPDNFVRRIARWTSHHRLKTFSIAVSMLLVFASVSAVSLYQQKQLIKQSKKNELIIGKFQREVSRQAYQIDRHILHLKGKLESFAEKVEFVLTNKLYAHEKIYEHVACLKPETAPGDFAFSSLYNIGVSIEYPCFKLSPGQVYKESEDSIKKLFQLRVAFRNLVLGSVPGAVITPDNIIQLKEKALTEGMPARWVFIGLESGLLVSSPGHTGYNPAYDPRERPWYKSALESDGAKWGKLYIGTSGQGLLFSCSIALHDRKGNLLGVAAIDLSFDYLTQSLMKAESVAPDSSVKEKFIVNSDGEILLSSNLENKKKQSGLIINENITLPHFPNEEIRSEVIAGREGIYQDEKMIYVYSKIPTINWFLVTKAEKEKLLK